MIDSDFRVLSEHPLNAEPPMSKQALDFLTPTNSTFHRNHGELLDKQTEHYTLEISSEVQGIQVNRTLSYRDVEKFRHHRVLSAMSCAGNRRKEMNEEKEVEGLQWGGSAIFNARWSGALLRDVLASMDIRLGHLEKRSDVDRLHLHFETTQECEDSDWFGSSLPVRMALDPNRPVLLATGMNGKPLTKEHGKPLRLVVPGIIGARSVKWLERIVLRDRPSDNFYMTRDYKVLPPEATPETKEDFMKTTEPMMILPLNSEICEPVDGETVTVDRDDRKIRVRGYALGSNGVPIESIFVSIVALPIPTSSLSAIPSTSSTSPGTKLPHPELHQIRLYASTLPRDRWIRAQLVSTPSGAEEDFEEDDATPDGMNYGWTLFSTEVIVPKEIDVERVEGKTVAIVAYAVDREGRKQELQTTWNLRGVGEASWSVTRVILK